MALALVCLAGVGVAATTLYVQSQIDRLGDGYTSFCTVNDSINCDRVLSSPYAKLAGVSVAWFALAVYLALAAAFARAAAAADDAVRTRLLRVGAVGILATVVFSGYMAVVALVRLETACLMCMGLYAVALTNAGLLVAALRTSTRITGVPPLKLLPAAGLFLGGVVSMVGLAFFTWPPPAAPLADDIRTAEDVRRVDPEFFAWFTALPRVDPSTLVRDDQAALTRSGKVVVVDFFDLECAHCRKNYLLTRELAARRPETVEIVHRHFPLDATCNDIVPQSIHRNACRAAEAVECAGLQGKHDEMLDILFKNQGQLFAENLTRLGGKIGLDKEELQRCLDDDRTLPLILADARAGARLEITSTPTVFVGGRRIKGSLEEVGKYEMAVLIEASYSP
ncbi:MAG: vitamin K epoxide reductase family protein [Candidatus Binatia bacterium]